MPTRVDGPDPWFRKRFQGLDPVLYSEYTNPDPIVENTLQFFLITLSMKTPTELLFFNFLIVFI